MDNLKKWTNKNLENIVIAYLAIVIISNLVFYIMNYGSISHAYFNLFVFESVFFIFAIGYFLLNLKTKKNLDIKGYAYAFLIFSFLTRLATLINYLLYYFIHDKYDFEYVLPFSTYAYPILLLLVIFLAYKKNILTELISNKKNNFSLFIIGMYLIEKFIKVPYKVMIDVSDSNYFIINYFEEILKNFIEFDGYFVIFASIFVFILPIVIMYILNAKYDRFRKRSVKATILRIFSILVFTWMIGQYGLYFYLGIMTGYQRDVDVIFEIIRRIEYIYVVLFAIIIVIKNRFND